MRILVPKQGLGTAPCGVGSDWIGIHKETVTLQPSEVDVGGWCVSQVEFLEMHAADIWSTGMLKQHTTADRLAAHTLHLHHSLHLV